MSGNFFSQLIFGRYSFSAQDGFENLFLDQCAKNNIRVYDFKKTGNRYTGWVNYHNIKPLLSSAEKSGMTVEITKRFGIIHIFMKYRKRFGIPVGLSLFCFITVFLNSMLWTIDIKGNNLISEYEIQSVLDESGVKKGVFTSTLNGKDVEFRLYKAFDTVSWVNVQFIGSRAFVTISEVEQQESITEKTISNIIAGKDGEIVRAEIFSGDGEIYPGTAVVKGDLLVSGVKTYRDGRVEFTESSAEIFARTKNYIHSSIAEKISVKAKKMCKDIYLLNFFGLSFSLSPSVKQADFTLNSYLFKSSDVTFPVGITRKHQYILEEKEILLSDNEKLLISFRDFSFSAMKLYSSAEITDCTINISSDFSDGIQGYFDCIEDIAVRKIFTVVEE